MQVIHGKVVHGKALGRTVGMPTANIAAYEKQLPASGVYATKLIYNGEKLDSVTNIGRRPSVDEEKHITVETYIFDFAREIYDAEVSLEIYKLIRPVMKFENLTEVHEQVQKDMLEVKKYFAQM